MIKRAIILSAIVLMALFTSESVQAEERPAISVGPGNIYAGDSFYYGSEYVGESLSSSKQVKVSWNVLDNHRANNGQAGIFCLSNMVNKNDWFADKKSNDYRNSNFVEYAESYCNEFLSDTEQEALIPTIKSDAEYTSKDGTLRFAAAKDILDGDLMFLPSAAEIENHTILKHLDNYRPFNSLYGTWTRSPDKTDSESVGELSYRSGSGKLVTNSACIPWLGGIDPGRFAFNLDMKYVIMISSPTVGKQVATEIGPKSLTAVNNTEERIWKLTLLDEDQEIEAERKWCDGKTLKLSYSVEDTSGNTGDSFTSVAIIDDQGIARYYGHIAKNSSEGTVELKLPNDVKETWTAYVFSEKINASDRTDYASEPVVLDLKITRKSIKFDSQGGSKVSTQTVKMGTAATTPKAPVKKGFIFKGWYLNGKAYDFKTPVTANITLTARWQKVTPKPGENQVLISCLVSSGKTAQTVSWNKIKGVSGYEIYHAPCSKKGAYASLKKVKTISGNSTFKWTKRGLKKNTAYKAYVKAYVIKNGKRVYVKTSPLTHAYTGGGTKKYTNASSISINRSQITLTKGKTFKIKASVKKTNSKKKLMPRDHAAMIRYISTNKKVATVSSYGKVTAKGKGTCHVYSYTHNGLSKTVKVTVK